LINVTDEKDVMLNFTARNHPKRKPQMDRAKMGPAFFDGLHDASNIHDRTFSALNLNHGIMFT
jgi:hypothetical protein